MDHQYVGKVIVPNASTGITSDFESYHHQKNMKKLSDLPSDLMAHILEGLSSADRMRFGATCKNNLSFVTTAKHRLRYDIRTIDKLPWRATFSAPGYVNLPRSLKYELFEPLRHHHHQGRRPHYATYEILDPKVEGLNRWNKPLLKASKKGWLLSVWPKETGLTSFLLFSPFNKRIITLPDLDHNLGNNNHLCLATFSSDPSSPDCVYFFLSGKEGAPRKFSISILHQTSLKWKTMEFDKLLISFSFRVSCVVYHERCFYFVSCNGELVAYDVVQQSCKVIIPKAPIYNWDYVYMFHILVCEGKLLLACVQISTDDESNVEMFRCRLYEFSSSTRTWVKRTSLGNHALFLGHPTSFSVPVSSCDNSIADRMYFRDGLFQLGPMYYSFKDGQCHAPEDGSYWSGDVHSGRWIEPPIPF